MNHWVDTKTTRLLKQKDSLNREAKKLEDKFIGRVNNLEEVFKQALEKLTEDFSAEVLKISTLCTEIEENTLEIQRGVEAYKAHVDRLSNSEARRLRKQIKDLETRLEVSGQKVENVTVNRVEVNKAKTLAIFDAILFNISNWSESGDTAPDFELASQAVLFPTVYERVMKGEEAYLLDAIPVSALEVVKRGREWVRYFREVCPLSLVDPTTWKDNIESVRSWWVNDALALIYEARDPAWEADAPFALTEMIAWRDYPANRALSFPLIYDGMGCVERHRDHVREETGLPDFNKTAIQTRLEVPVQ